MKDFVGVNLVHNSYRILLYMYRHNIDVIA